MAFVDYKCLESLLIEGEEIIATEGLGSKIGSFIKSAFNFFMQIINKIIKFIDAILSKLKLKKTIHNDKATYNKARALSKKCYVPLNSLCYDIPVDMSLIISRCFTAETDSIRYIKTDYFNDYNIDYFNDYINETNEEYEKCNQRFVDIKNTVQNNTLYFTNMELDSINSTLRKSKDFLEKTSKTIKNKLNRIATGDPLADPLANTKTAQETAEQQKRISEFMKYATKYETLFANVEKFIMNNVSSDIITYEDRMKYEYV